jgi:MraZ protein
LFTGEFQHSLDDKGRLTIPAKFREGLGQRFVVTRGLDRCLFVYPQEEWSALEERVKTLPTAQADVRAFVRLLFSGAVDTELDKQGRAGLPQNLRTYAGIDRDVIVIGVSTRVEIWSAAVWAEYAGQAEAGFSEMAEKIVGLGI